MVEFKGFKKHFIHKNAIWVVPCMISGLAIMFLVYINFFQGNSNSYDSEIIQKTAFFDPFKMAISFGISMALTSLLLLSSSIYSIDMYLKKEDQYIFLNQKSVIILKISMGVIGIFLTVLGGYLEPETSKEIATYDYLSIGIGFIFIISLLANFFLSVKKMIKNRNDYLSISPKEIVWFDDQIKSIQKIAVSEIRYFNKKFDGNEKAPEVIAYLFLMEDGSEVKIDMEGMSLISQNEFINELLLKFISPKEELA